MTKPKWRVFPLKSVYKIYNNNNIPKTYVINVAGNSNIVFPQVT